MSYRITTRYQCVKCLLRAASEIIEKTMDNEEQRIIAMEKVFKILSETPREFTPVEASNRINVMVRDFSGIHDPYLEDKRERNRMAAAVLPDVKERVEKMPDPFFGAVMAAAAGNILDRVAGDDKKLEEALEHAFRQGFVKNDYPRLQGALENADKILYIADNSGEIFFDSLVVEKLKDRGKDVVFCVRGGPAVDDALKEDWQAAGLHLITSLVTTGSTHLGCMMDQAGRDFMNAFDDAQLIIAKGMGNFETLGGLDDHRIFCILKAKCSCVADALGVKTGDLCLVRL